MVCVNKRVRLANRDFSFEDYPGVDPEGIHLLLIIGV